MTLKRRAEISADIFARLLRYFFLSCKNLTIKAFYFDLVLFGAKIALLAFAPRYIVEGLNEPLALIRKPR